MTRLGPKNPIVKRIIVIVLCILFAVGIVFFAATKLLNTNALNYDIGERDMDKIYNDIIVKNYTEYLDVVKNYNIATDLKNEDFDDNYYLISFQEYDKCSETKHKKVNKVNSSDGVIEVEFERYNKCGWCKSHIILYLIKIDKIDNPQNVKINYKYIDDKVAKCGNALE